MDWPSPERALHPNTGRERINLLELTQHFIEAVELAPHIRGATSRRRSSLRVADHPGVHAGLWALARLSLPICQNFLQPDFWPASNFRSEISDLLDHKQCDLCGYAGTRDYSRGVPLNLVNQSKSDSRKLLEGTAVQFESSQRPHASIMTMNMVMQGKPWALPVSASIHGLWPGRNGELII